MRGVVLCGGLGTRLRPLTSVVNKHLLPVYKKPMCFYSLEMLAEAGVSEIMIVVGGQSTEEIMKLCKDGRDFGFKRLYYAYQEGEGGIAAALALAEEFADGSDIVVCLGDNILLGESLKPHKEVWDKARLRGSGAMVLLSEVSDPENYGVPTFDEKGRLLFISEKPELPATNQAVIGVYFYDWSVFDRIKTCTPSGRGEMEITDVNNSYAQDGLLKHGKVKGKWIDAGSSIDAWLQAGQLVEEYTNKPNEETEWRKYSAPEPQDLSVAHLLEKS